MGAGYWSTGTKEVLIVVISGAFSIALIALTLKNASGLSKLLTGGGEAFNKVLKTAMGGGQGF